MSDAEDFGPRSSRRYRRDILLRGLDEIGRTLLDEPPYRRLRAQPHGCQWTASLSEPREEAMKEFTIAVLRATGSARGHNRGGKGPDCGSRPLWLPHQDREYGIGAAGVIEAGEARRPEPHAVVTRMLSCSCRWQPCFGKSYRKSAARSRAPGHSGSSLVPTLIYGR